jgi:hypothetical protein
MDVTIACDLKVFYLEKNNFNVERELKSSCTTFPSYQIIRTSYGVRDNNFSSAVLIHSHLCQCLIHNSENVGTRLYLPSKSLSTFGYTKDVAIIIRMDPNSAFHIFIGSDYIDHLLWSPAWVL